MERRTKKKAKQRIAGCKKSLKNDIERQDRRISRKRKKGKKKQMKNLKGKCC